MSSREYWIVPMLVAIGVAYAWWTQPYVGPASFTSTMVRSLVIAVWASLFFVIKNAIRAQWSWKQFIVGAVVGGAWLSLVALTGDTIAKVLGMVSMGVVVGGISGLYATLVSTTSRAAMVGIGILVAQLLVAIVVHGLGWTKYSYGM